MPQPIDQDWFRTCIDRRIEAAIAHFLTHDALFDELNQSEMVEQFSRILMKKVSPADFEVMTEEDLCQRTRRFLGVEVLAGLIGDFTAEEMAEFDAAVAGQR